MEEGEVQLGGEEGEEVHRGEDFTGEEGWGLVETVCRPPTIYAGVASSPVTLSRIVLPTVCDLLPCYSCFLFNVHIMFVEIFRAFFFVLHLPSLGVVLLG